MGTQHHPPHLVLYDGVCGFCHLSVKWLIELDGQKLLKFAPLQGETAEEMRTRFPSIPKELDTVVYVEGDSVYLRSRAFFELCKHFAYPWRFAAIFRFFPSFLSDLAYRVIAHYRYKIFGQKDECTIPTPDERARYLP